MKFQKLAIEALSFNYIRANVFNKNLTLRLVIAVVNRSNLISKAMATKEYTFYFNSSNTKKDSDKGSRAGVLKALDVAAIKLDSN